MYKGRGFLQGIKRFGAYLLCAAVLVNSAPMEAFAADDMFVAEILESADDEPVVNISESADGVDAPEDDIWEIKEEQSVAATEEPAAEPNEEQTVETKEEQAVEAKEASDGLTQEPEAGSGTQNFDVPNGSGNAYTEPDGGAAGSVMGESEAAMQDSVSSSDLGLAANSGIINPPLFYAASEEQLNMDVTYPNGYNTSTNILPVSNSSMGFTVDLGLSGTTVQNPIIKIHIPSCMEIIDYPKADHQYLKSYLASGDSVSLSSNVLTYKFISKVAWVNFGVSTRIASPSQLKDGSSYEIKIEYYDGSKLLKSQTSSFTVSNRTVQTGALYPNSWTYSTYLNKGVSNYEIEYTRYLRNSYPTHYPYSSVKMITLIPDNSVPGTKDASGTFKQLANGGSVSLSGFKVTYNQNYRSGSTSGRALIYELSSGNSFLTSGSICTLSGIYLRFTNPTKGINGKRISPRVEAVIDGKTIVMSEFTESAYEYAEFLELPGGSVDPYSGWSDLIYLKDGQREYYTNNFYRSVYVSPYGEHAPYDSVKMTVCLPQGAVPGFNTGSSFTPLKNNVTQTNGSFKVTYQQNYSYGGKSYPALVYELAADSNATIMSYGGSYSFLGDNLIYLRFTNPQPGEYEAPAPKIECFSGKQVIASFDEPDNTAYKTTVTVIKPPTDSGVYSDFEENTKKQLNNGYGWYDTIMLEEGQKVYYTKAFKRAVYTSDPDPHYAYDSVKMTVLLPNEAEPGFGTGSAFEELEDGNTYTVSTIWGSFKVTYHKEYSYSDETGKNKGTAKALVYVMDGSTTATFLKSGKSFNFAGYLKNIYLRFTEPKIGTYHSPGSPLVECVIDGLRYYTTPYFSETTFDTSVTFEAPRVDWEKFSISGGTNDTAYGISSQWVLPHEYQKDKEYLGYILNDTGYELHNVRVSYTFDEGLDADKLTFNLGESGFPTKASVAYKTKSGIENTVNVSVGGNEVSLEKGDAFLTAEVIYDSLGSDSEGKNVMTADIHNYNKINETGYAREIKAEALSAGSELDVDSKEDSFFKTKSAKTPFGLKSLEYILSATVSIDSTSLNKGDAFNVTINAGNENQIYKNLSLYIQMPAGYILTGYTAPEGYGKGYTVTSRTLENNNRDILYCLKYTDDKLYPGGSHVFSFRVGPMADTSKRQTNVSMPKAVYAAVDEESLFQFRTIAAYSKLEETIGMDVNDDGDEDDRFYMPLMPNVSIMPLGFMTVEGYLSSDLQVGEDTSYKYSADSKGTYRLYIYNGAGSGAVATDGVIKIALPRADQKYVINDKICVAEWDCLLSSAVSLEGDFLENASVEYSLDGGKTWQESVNAFSEVTHIQIKTEKDRELMGTQSARVSFSFVPNFADDKLVDSEKEYKSYVGAEMEYSLSTSPERTSAVRYSEMTAESAEFGGVIFRDLNGNLAQDDTEKTGNAQNLTLYYGEDASGEKLQDIAAKDDGSFSFSILASGTYTLHADIEKGAYYEHKGVVEGCVFDQNGNYTFTLGGSESVHTKGLKLGTVLPRIMEPLGEPIEGFVGESSVKITPEIAPALPEGGDTVTFESTNPDAATVDEDGNINFAGFGETDIIARAPQFPAVISILGEEDALKLVTQSVHVTGRERICEVKDNPVIRQTPSGDETENPIKLVLKLGDSYVKQDLYYCFNVSGGCTILTHTDNSDVTAQIIDDNNAGASLIPVDASKAESFKALDGGNVAEYKGFRFAASKPGTYKLRFSREDKWGHSDENRPEDIEITVQVELEKLQPPEYSILPELPDGGQGWYITAPQIILDSNSTAMGVKTWFKDVSNQDAPYKVLTEADKPLANNTGIYNFEAYNTYSIPGGDGEEIVSETSDKVFLNEVKVDIDKPVIIQNEEAAVEYSPVGTGVLEKIGNFLSFGNFFKEALRVKVSAYDVGSGLSGIHYILPGGEEKSGKIEDGGICYFDIPMDICGRIIYYVTDAAGNQSEKVMLVKENGSDLWVTEDNIPLLSDFELIGISGSKGVSGIDGKLWFPESVIAKVNVKDEDSGIAKVSIGVDGDEDVQFVRDDLDKNGIQTSADLSKIIDAEGMHDVLAQVEDNAKNTADCRVEFGVDKTAPAIVLEEKKLLNDIPYATITVTDAGSGIEPGDIKVFWNGEDVLDKNPGGIEPIENGYRITFSINTLDFEEEGAAFTVTAKDLTGHANELLVTRYIRDIVYVSAFSGGDRTGDGSVNLPFKTTGYAMERVAPKGTVVLLDNYKNVINVDGEFTLDLNGKTVIAEVPGSSIAVKAKGRLTVKDSGTVGSVYGGTLGDPAFWLEDGAALCLTDGIIYCGYTGNGEVEILPQAEMMYLLTYSGGLAKGEDPGYQYVRADTNGALKQNTYTLEGYSFLGWMQGDKLYKEGQEILMPDKNIEVVARWEIVPVVKHEPEDEDEPDEPENKLDSVPKTGRTQSGRTAGNELQKMEFCVDTKKKKDEEDGGRKEL